MKSCQATERDSPRSREGHHCLFLVLQPYRSLNIEAIQVDFDEDLQEPGRQSLHPRGAGPQEAGAVDVVGFA